MNKVLAVVLALFVIAPSSGVCGYKPQPRIIGGHQAEAVPVVYISVKRGHKTFQCSGTVLGEGNWILTASHCVEDKHGNPVDLEDIAVRVGGNGPSLAEKSVFGVVNVFLNNYDRAGNQDDLALLELDYPYVGVTQLLLDPSENVPETGDVYGWGTTKVDSDFQPLPESVASTLMGVEVPILEDSACQSVYGSNYDPETMICAGSASADACDGDSGGPLMVNGLQIGIVAYGLGCARPGYPGVYIDVRAYAQWIYEYIGYPKTKIDTVSNSVFGAPSSVGEVATPSSVEAFSEAPFINGIAVPSNEVYDNKDQGKPEVRGSIGGGGSFGYFLLLMGVFAFFRK